MEVHVCFKYCGPKLIMQLQTRSATMCQVIIKPT